MFIVRIISKKRTWYEEYKTFNVRIDLRGSYAMLDFMHMANRITDTLLKYMKKSTYYHADLDEEILKFAAQRLEDIDFPRTSSSHFLKKFFQGGVQRSTWHL